jgi:hypothetical protein
MARFVKMLRRHFRYSDISNYNYGHFVTPYAILT